VVYVAVDHGRCVGRLLDAYVIMENSAQEYLRTAGPNNTVLVHGREYYHYLTSQAQGAAEDINLILSPDFAERLAAVDRSARVSKDPAVRYYQSRAARRLDSTAHLLEMVERHFGRIDEQIKASYSILLSAIEIAGIPAGAYALKAAMATMPAFRLRLPDKLRRFVDAVSGKGPASKRAPHGGTWGTDKLKPGQARWDGAKSLDPAHARAKVKVTTARQQRLGRSSSSKASGPRRQKITDDVPPSRDLHPGKPEHASRHQAGGVHQRLEPGARRSVRLPLHPDPRLLAEPSGALVRDHDPASAPVRELPRS